MQHIRLILILLLLPLAASAQFYVTGDDPGRLKWNYIDTDSYRIIYPQESDSLARVYARNLEKYKLPVSRTTGYRTGEGDGRLMPVVMHTYNAANGSVAWAPKRMDLFTVPSAYDPEPMPWATMLSVHESRHITQMQFGMTRAQRPLYFIFGEMWNILASLLYPGLSNIEGDAVITETALTPSGRGRTADFLNYYWVAFDNGDFRKWDKWRFVSQKYYAPNHYSLGYLTIGGFRYLYDCPDVMAEAYRRAAGNPLRLGAFYRTFREHSGKKFDEAFLEVCDTMYTLWKSNADKRAPYIPSEKVLREPKRYTDYENLLVSGDYLYAVRKGHAEVPSLVRIDSLGQEKRISSFSYNAGRLQRSPYLKRLYWSETLPDERWTLKTDSKVRFMEEGQRRKHTLKNKSLLFNPAPTDQAHMAAGRYYVTGGSSLEIISGIDGKTKKTFDAPDSLQIIETSWIGTDVYATAVSDNGYGIYRFPLDKNLESTGGWETVLSPQPVMLKDLSVWKNELIFTCDRTGVNELYHLDPSTGSLTQKTSTRYGASDFQYSEDGRWLYYSSQTMKGKHIMRTPADSLISRKADFTILHKYPIAEKITRQEKEAAMKDGLDEAVSEKEIKISEPERYRKLPHMFNLHSWAPVYVNVDNIMKMSYDYIWQAASLGATGILQNRLATAVGEFGYSAHKDPYDRSQWRHSGHARLTYSGWYPILEASVDINDRAARQFNTAAYIMGDSAGAEISSRPLDIPYVSGNFSAYIPFNFSSGGWYKGIIPRVSYTLSNDRFNTRMAVMSYNSSDGSFGENPVFLRSTEGKNRIRQFASASVRFYTSMATASSAVYPRWGVGVEAGATGSIESYDYLSPMGYVYGYGYVPGFIKTQGMKLTAIWQTKLRKESLFSQQAVGILPRGFNKTPSLGSWLSVRNDNMVKVTADYAIPIYIGEVALGGNFFSIKRLILSPHFDYTFVGKNGLWSAGSEFLLDLHSILTLEWPVQIGVTYSFNGGTKGYFSTLSHNTGLEMKRHFWDFVFNVTF